MQVYYSEDRLGVSNLMGIHSSLTGLTYEQIEQQCEHMDTGKYKLHLSEVLVEHFHPIRKRMSELYNNRDYVERVLNNGREQAAEAASQTMAQVKDIIGLK